MKKIYTLLLSATLIFTSCSKDAEVAEIPASQIQSIVDAAVAAALAQLSSTVNTLSPTIAQAAADAATAAVAAGLSGQADVIDAAVKGALEAQAAADAAAAAAAASNLIESVGAAGGVTFIDGSTNWTNDRIWTINGKVVVRSGGVLNIQAGTIVKAYDGTGVDATVLVIAAGGQINAIGTAEAPIIFTDIKDEITYSDNGVSPNRVPSDMGKWGSIVVLGNAIVGEDGGTDDIEGIADGFTWTQYGGSNAADNSGRLEYLSVRHSGQEIAPNNELQAITFGGVGSGTTVQNIEIIGSQDDGIEIFGGSVNVTNLIIHYNGDDAIDLDEGYSGTIDNAVLVMNTMTDGAFEIDGTEDSTGAITGEFTVQNVTVYGQATQDDTNQYGTWKSGATGLTKNVVFKSFNTGTTMEQVHSNYAGKGTATASGQLLFDDFDFVTSDTIATIFAAVNSVVTDASTWAESVASQVSGTGADETVFSWCQYYK